MKHIITIKPDYDSNSAFDFWKEQVTDYAMENNIAIQCVDNDYVSRMFEWTNTDDESSTHDWVEVVSRWYSQGDRLEFAISKKDERLEEQLTRFFSHKNEYYMRWVMENEDGRQKPMEINCTGFVIDDVEFPSEERIIEEAKQLLEDHTGEFENLEFIVEV